MLFPSIVFIDGLQPVDKYKRLKRYWMSYRYHILLSYNCIQPFDITSICTNSEVRRWLEWINKNICLNLGYEFDSKTLEVKLRIATGMLNKIESLTDEEKIQLHSNLVRNIRTESTELLISELPF